MASAEKLAVQHPCAGKQVASCKCLGAPPQEAGLRFELSLVLCWEPASWFVMLCTRGAGQPLVLTAKRGILVQEPKTRPLPNGRPLLRFLPGEMGQWGVCSVELQQTHQRCRFIACLFTHSFKPMPTQGSLPTTEGLQGPGAFLVAQVGTQKPSKPTGSFILSAPTVHILQQARLALGRRRASSALRIIKPINNIYDNC